MVMHIDYSRDRGIHNDLEPAVVITSENCVRGFYYQHNAHVPGNMFPIKRFDKILQDNPNPDPYGINYIQFGIINLPEFVDCFLQGTHPKDMSTKIIIIPKAWSEDDDDSDVQDDLHDQEESDDQDDWDGDDYWSRRGCDSWSDDDLDTYHPHIYN